jgi:Tfp pilus assembly protein PilZ
VSRVDVRLEDKSEWVKIFDPRDFAIFVPGEDPPQVGVPLRVDLSIGDDGPRIILRGTVASRREKSDGNLAAGCTVVLGPHEREKINYMNGFVRGGLLNLREKRRLPMRLPVTYGAIDGPRKTHTRDINEEGIFVISEEPLPEETQIHLIVTVPNRDEPLSLSGEVTHTVLVEDEDLPGMGIVFAEESRSDELIAIIDELEQAFLHGKLDDEFLL